MRSFGDSKRPFWYLLASSVTNIALDILFIAILHMGAAGAGIATTIAQGASALLIIVAMLKEGAPYQIVVRHIRIEKALVPEILQMGLP